MAPEHLQQKGIADKPLGQRVFNGEEIAVPAAVLKDAEQAVVRLAGGDHLVGLGHAQAHGLVGDDVFARRQRLDRVRGVEVVGRGEDD